MGTLWKSNWEQTRANICKWWKRQGPVLAVFAPADKPHEEIAPPPEMPDLQMRWLDPYARVKRSMYQVSRTYHGGDAFPMIDTLIGPGSLGTFIGSEPGLSKETVWYHPCISDPESYPEIRFNPEDYWFNVHRILLETGVRLAEGRFIVGMPDLIENIDILSQMRDPQTLMLDLIERPEWVEQSVAQINRVYFEAFDKLYEILNKTPWGGNAFCAFHLWGPGKTAKLQCDASAMFSTEMYQRFVVPALTEQCRWLDNSMYHLDGTQAMHHLDTLLKIEALDAIEWTPQAGIENGGNARWYPLYKKILAAGKGVQAVGVKPEEVKPLLDACGGEGLYIMCSARTQSEAQRLEDLVEKYR